MEGGSPSLSAPSSVDPRSPLTLETALDALHLDPTKVKNVYVFGSRAYGTAKEDSDYDLVIVMEGYTGEPFLDADGIDAMVYNPAAFQLNLDEHYIFAVLCLFLPPQFVWKQEIQFQFQLSLGKLRSSVSK